MPVIQLNGHIIVEYVIVFRVQALMLNQLNNSARVIYC
jgi:hypothetical protein